jgi:murein DD-endopeptidase MepM/ murein hydrolase activator NlpD
MKLLAWIKGFLAVFLSFVLKPVAFLLNIIFLKLSAKVYLAYFSFAKKIGWNRLRGNFLSFIFSRKTVHVLLAFLVAAISISGLSGRQIGAKTLYDNVGKTILAGLVTSEFPDIESSDLIEETASSQLLGAQMSAEYLDKQSIAFNEFKIATGTSEAGAGLLADSGRQDDGVIVKPELALTQESKKTRKEAIVYVVEPGDVIGLIADKFDISVNTILWENNLSAYSLIRPGDKLVILPATGITHKIAKGETLGALAGKYNVAAEDILLANNLPEDSKLSVGQKLLIPGGQKIYYAAPAPRVANSYNPVQVIKDIFLPSSNTAAPGKMLWPTVGHIITQYFSWRHGGLDIANKIGTPIYAAESGVITDSGWSTAGYGNKVDIDHGGGIVTRYGHASKLLVKKGDTVKKGDVIMLMGSTGRSTGPHLHFEVRIRGRVQNPLSYIR